MRFKLTFEAADWIEHTEFWCNYCDARKVHTNNHASGRFFTQAGHQHIPGLPHGNGDYHSVIFAVCNDCLEEMR